MPTYDFFDHDRFKQALAVLNASALTTIHPPTLFGYVALLERWMSTYHVDGDLTGVSDDRIEAAVDWFPPNVPEFMIGKFAACMHLSGLIHVDEDGRTVFRGWPEHAPEFVKKRLARRTTAADGGQRRPMAADGGQRPPRGEARGGEARGDHCLKIPTSPSVASEAAENAMKDSAASPRPPEELFRGLFGEQWAEQWERFGQDADRLSKIVRRAAGKANRKAYIASAISRAIDERRISGLTCHRNANVKPG
jgi:hypothetical protein